MRSTVSRSQLSFLCGMLRRVVNRGAWWHIARQGLSCAVLLLEALASCLGTAVTIWKQAL
jgi:hypothetical protein